MPPAASGTFSYRTAKVERGEMLPSIEATGTIEPEEVVDIGAQVTGVITELYVDYGSVVAANQKLAQIDPTKYQAACDQAATALALANANLAQAKANLAKADADVARNKELIKVKGISQADYDTFVANDEVAKANVGVAEASIGQAKSALKSAQTDLDYTVIKSPVKGVVIDRRVNVGQTQVSALSASSLFLLAKDLSRLQVWVSVNEADTGRIHPGQTATFTVDTFPNENFTGEVSQIRLNATMTQNVVTYTVVVTTENKDLRLLPYMTANVNFEVEHHDGVLKVPNAALRWKPRPAQIAPDIRAETLAAMSHRGDKSKSKHAGDEKTAAKGDTAQNAATKKPAAIDHEPPGTPVSAGNLAAKKEHFESGYLWTVDGSFVRPIKVKIIATDGMMTEVRGEGLKENGEIVTGENVAANGDSGSTGPGMRNLSRGLTGSSNNILVLPGAGVSFGAGSRPTLTPEDGEQLAKQCPAITCVAPIVQARAQLVYDRNKWNTRSVVGTSPSYLEVRDWSEMEEGDVFTDRDMLNANKVCMVGTTIKREVFDNKSPVGKELRINNVAFRVVGVLSSKGTNMMGMDEDDIVVAPWTTIKYRVSALSNAVASASPTASQTSTATVNSLSNLYPNSTALYADVEPQSVQPVTVDNLLVKAASTVEIPEAIREIKSLLRERHRIKTPSEDDDTHDDFNIRNMTVTEFGVSVRCSPDQLRALGAKYGDRRKGEFSEQALKRLLEK